MSQTPRLLYLVADYGDDLAFAEVHLRLRKLVREPFDFQMVRTPKFSTVATGFAVAQLALEGGINPPLIFHNTDPRADGQEHAGNDGSPLVFVRLKNGAEVIGPNAGYCFSFLPTEVIVKAEVDYEKPLDRAFGFRSRDWFPSVVSAISKGVLSTTVEGFRPSLVHGQVNFASLPTDRTIACWVDGYGNVKTSERWLDYAEVPDGEEFTVQVLRENRPLHPEAQRVVFRAKGDFHSHAGEISLLPGSSGPLKNRYLELFARCNSAHDKGASELLGGVLPGDTINLQLHQPV